MKITLISALSGVPTIYPFEGYGGIERIVADLANELHKRGYDVELIAYKGSKIPDVKTRYLNNEYDAKEIPLRDGVVIDFSHLKMYKHPKYSVPFLTDAMGTNPIFPTYFVRDMFLQANPSLAMGGKVIYPGTDLQSFLTAVPTVQQDYFTFMSRIAPYKGVHEVISIANTLNVKLKIAGHIGEFSNGDKYANKILEMSREYPNIELIGNITEEQKTYLLVNSKGLIAYPMWNLLGQNLGESFGIFAVEALACGIPVFLPNIPNGCNEIITKATGLLFDPFAPESIGRFESTPEICRERAKYFSIERYASDLLEYISKRE